MRTVLCAGSVLVILVSACSSQPAESAGLHAPVVPTTHEATIVWHDAVEAPEEFERPALAPIRRVSRPRLPAPSGLRAAYYDLPFLITEPVLWDDSGENATAVALTAPDVIAGQPAFVDPTSAAAMRIDVASAVGRLNSQSQTLATLALQHAELGQTLISLRAIIPTLPTARRLRAGLKACALRRELDALAEAQRELLRDVVAARDVLDPQVQVATR